MEVKVENKKDERIKLTARVWNFIKEEHSFENWLLFVLALVLLVLSLYILVAAASDNNSFADTYFNITQSGWGIFDKPWKVITISSVIVALSVASIVYCLWPVFKPSIKELKFVTWTNKRTLFVNSVTVLSFIILLSGFFYLLDFALVPLIKLILGD